MTDPINLSNAMYSDEFLRSFGILSDFQKNNLVLVTMCACTKIKNVHFTIDSNNKNIDATLYLGWFNLKFANKQKIVNQLKALYSEYIPNYTIRIKFQYYVRQQLAKETSIEQTSDGDRCPA